MNFIERDTQKKLPKTVLIALKAIGVMQADDLKDLSDADIDELIKNLAKKVVLVILIIFDILCGCLKFSD